MQEIEYLSGKMCFMVNFSRNMVFLLLAVLLCGAIFAAHKLGGNRKEGEVWVYPVLLVEFEDVVFTLENPREAFDALLNGKGYSKNGASGSAADYLNENFRGKRRFGFDVFDVVSLPVPIAEYGAPGAAFNDCNVLQMVKDACDAAVAAGYNLAVYDNDADGYTDNVAIVFAGRSEPDGGGENSIWPHQGTIPVPDARIEGGKISSYTCTPELSGLEQVQIAPAGTFCHEFLHALGLPDLYDTNGEEEGLAPGAYGTLSIMDKGNLLNGGKVPPYLNVVEREILGIIEVEDLLPNSSYVLNPVNESDIAYRIPTATPGEYFLLECRVEQGWDTHIGGSGMVVYHVDKSSRICGGLSASSRWNFNNVNSFALHECLRVISPAGAGETVGNIFYPGKSNAVQLVSWEGDMPLRDWAGHSLGIGIVDIAFVDGKVSFRSVGDLAFDPNLPQVTGVEAIPFQDEVRLQWSNPQEWSADMEWLVKLGVKGDADLGSSIKVDTAGCYIGGLEPDVEYEIKVSSLYGERYGEPWTVNTRTLGVTSMFPYIHILGKGYSVGDVVDLRVLNLVEEHVSVDWQVNGAGVDGGSFCVESAGEYRIKAVIKYKDGSYESIYKNIEVR